MATRQHMQPCDTGEHRKLLARDVLLWEELYCSVPNGKNEMHGKKDRLVGSK